MAERSTKECTASMRKSVDMEIAQPHLRVVTEESAHLVRAGLFKIHGAAPRSLMGIREIWTEFSGVISGRTKVVVDNVEQAPPGQGCAQR